MQIKILIADGHTIVCTGIAKVLGEVEDFQVVGQARTGEEALQLVQYYSPDIVSIDVDLPGPVSGLEMIRLFRSMVPHANIVILTNHLEEMIIRDALRAGVLGYLLKTVSADDLVYAIRSAHQGIPTLSPEVTRLVVRQLSAPLRDGRNLTSREREVLKLIVRGLNNQDIAKELNISLSTVQFHVSNILDKLGVHNRIEATAFAVRHRLAD